MKLDLTEKQTQILAKLIAAKKDIEAKLDLVIQTLAAGTDLEGWEGVNLDIEAKTLTFTEKEIPKEA